MAHGLPCPAAALSVCCSGASCIFCISSLPFLFPFCSVLSFPPVPHSLHVQGPFSLLPSARASWPLRVVHGPGGGGPGVRLPPGPRGGLRPLSCLGELGRPCSGLGVVSVLLRGGGHGLHRGVNPFHLLSLQRVWGVRPPPSPGVRGRRAEGKEVGSLLQPHKSRRINRGPPRSHLKGREPLISRPLGTAPLKQAGGPSGARPPSLPPAGLAQTLAPALS